MSATNVSPSRGNALTGALLKARRRKNRNTADTDSTGSNGGDGTLSVQWKQEGLIDNMKQNDGLDEEDCGESSTLSKIMPKGLSPKRRRRKLELEEKQRALEAARGSIIAERGILDEDGDISMIVDDDGSNLITYESENETHLTRPPLSAHSSHIGYLTTSSPLVKASTLPETTNSELQLDGASKSSRLPQTGTLATSETLPKLNTSALQDPNKEPPIRPTPSVDIVRDTFNPRRGASPGSSPERNPDIVSVLGAPLARDSTEGVKKREFVASRIGVDKQTSQRAPSSEHSPEPGLGRPTQQISTNERPQTPPANDSTAPIIVNTPPTPTDHGAQNFSGARERGASDPITITNPNVVTSSSGNMISHRRIKSVTTALGPSKLSRITSTPLTPTPENGPTPQTSNATNNQQGGFFSTMFSAAQNAASTLSNSIANTSLAQGQTKNRNVLLDLKEVEDVEVAPEVEEAVPGQSTEQKEPAVKTLGMGDLSLSQLGIPEPNSTPISSLPPEEQERSRLEPTNRDDPAPNQTLASLVRDSFENGRIIQADDSRPAAWSRSVNETSASIDQTPNDNVANSKGGMAQGSSIQSTVKPRRKRESSGATGTTVGTATALTSMPVAHSNTQGSTPKLTGFAVASKKRNRDFHQLFRSVPENDYLIEDYSCALQREILAHGRLYVSEGYLCFSSNILGWVTTLIMSFDEIISVEKRSTALVFKNGLMISTLHAKNIFASFTSRDSTYDLIVGIWRLGHPNLRSSLNGVSIEETGGGDKTETYDTIGSQSVSGSEDDSEGGEEVYDEDDEDDGMSYAQTGEGSAADSDTADKLVSRKPSNIGATSNNTPVEKNKESNPVASSTDFPGPASHTPTDCSDKEFHYDKVISDEVIPAPLGKVYSMLFGPTSPSWMSKWLTNEQKCHDLQMDDKKGLSNENKIRVFSYIKPLNSPLAPKQTKCIITETLDSIDLEKAVSITVSTQTPDVPSGNLFNTKTKYCLSWAEGNSTRLQMNCMIEWTGKSWLKGPIEKGANDGQKDYAKDICTSLKASVSGHRNLVVAPGKMKKKGRKEKSSQSSPGKLDGASDSKASTVEEWGFLEPLRGPLGPVLNIVKPLLSGNMGYGLLVGLLVAAWFGFGYRGGGAASKDMNYFGTPERIAAYEEIWRREESELWDWLEERVGMERIYEDPGQASARTDDAKSIEEKLREEKTTEREMETAIRVTEEKLNALKGVLEKQKRLGSRNRKFVRPGAYDDD